MHLINMTPRGRTVSSCRGWREAMPMLLQERAREADGRNLDTLVVEPDKRHLSHMAAAVPVGGTSVTLRRRRGPRPANQ